MLDMATITSASVCHPSLFDEKMHTKGSVYTAGPSLGGIDGG
jgi:hypothetical protein